MVRGRFLVASMLLLAGCGDGDEDPAAGDAPPAPELEGAGRLTLYVLESPGLAMIGPEYAEGVIHDGSARFWRGQWPACRSVPEEYGCHPPSGCSYPGDQDVEDVTAGFVTFGPLSLQPPDYEVTGPGVPWNEGDSLEIDAEGDPAGAPAFQGSVMGPSFVTLVDPAPGAFTLAGTESLEVVWSGNGSGDVMLSVHSLDAGAGFRCRWPSADGSGLIPGELLDALEPAGDGTSYTANLHGFSDTEITTGSFSVMTEIRATRSESAFGIDVP